MQLQQTLQLVFCFVADVLKGHRKQVSIVVCLGIIHMRIYQALLWRICANIATGIIDYIEKSELCLISTLLPLNLERLIPNSDLIWCAILPVQPPLLPVWTHHVSDYWVSYKKREDRSSKTMENIQFAIHYGSCLHWKYITQTLAFRNSMVQSSDTVDWPFLTSVCDMFMSGSCIILIHGQHYPDSWVWSDPVILGFPSFKSQS